MKKYIAIPGTNRAGSTNRRLLQFIQHHFADQAEIEIMEIGGLPGWNRWWLSWPRLTG